MREMAEAYLTNLPDDLLLRVVVRTGDTVSLVGLGSTSKRLRALVAGHLTGVRARFTDDSLKYCVQGLANLQRLEVQMFSPVRNAEPLASLTRLYRLICPFVPLFKSPQCCSFLPVSICELDIRGSRLAAGCVEVISKKLPGLRMLDIRDTSIPGDHDFLTPLTACPNLEVLGMSGSGRDSSKLWAQLAGLRHLHSLLLNHAEFQSPLDESACPTQLRSLRLEFSSLAWPTVEGATAALLGSLPGLHRLHVDNLIGGDDPAVWQGAYPDLVEVINGGFQLDISGLQLPKLHGLWLHPALDVLVPSYLPPPHVLARISKLVLVDVATYQPLAGEVLSRLRLTELALVRCSFDIEKKLLPGEAEAPESNLEILTLIHDRPDPVPKLKAPALPKLRLLQGNSPHLYQLMAAEPNSWILAATAAVLDPKLREFSRHIGRWRCFVKKGTEVLLDLKSHQARTVMS